MEYVTGTRALELRCNSSIRKDRSAVAFVMSLSHLMALDAPVAKQSCEQKHGINSLKLKE